MTRIETIFGGFLAVAVLSVFAFVFFGSTTDGTASSSTSSTASRGAFVRTSVATLLDEDRAEEYEIPATACGCYNMGYDLIRSNVKAGTELFEGQVQACYDRVGPMGAEALSDGAMAASAVPRERKSCRAGDYIAR
ncbi:hypothetical protein [Parvularcula maris]|uniref:Uncharacterized protein n=1 Tax=Parvularcula maris TaxID=2965077 RepID=A0A9X2L7V6_9PROT|nr:hypothetical protein [Parvularcula maris]MCQ8184700.1 hypothetical protein [Parvularcula maris]